MSTSSTIDAREASRLVHQQTGTGVVAVATGLEVRIGGQFLRFAPARSSPPTATDSRDGNIGQTAAVVFSIVGAHVRGRHPRGI